MDVIFVCVMEPFLFPNSQRSILPLSKFVAQCFHFGVNNSSKILFFILAQTFANIRSKHLQGTVY